MASSAERIGVGVIGTGWVAGAHVETFQKIPGCEIVAFNSRKKARAEQRISELGLTGATAYADLDKFLAHPGLDVVTICTPHTNHPAETIACAQAGKHMVIEKPVAMEVASLKKMIAAVNAAKVKTSVCFEVRWGGLFSNIRAMIDQGLIGKIFYGECSYWHGVGPWYQQYSWNIKKRMGGDALLTAGCHALDALIWSMQSRVVEVAAMSNTSPDNPLKYEYDPNSVAILSFANGAIGKVATSIECRQPYLFPVLFQGDAGTIWNDQISSLRWPGLKTGQWAKIPTSMPDSGDVHDHPYLPQFQHFIECLRQNKRPANDLNDAAHTHEVMFAIDQAISTKKMVKVVKTPGT